jgi:hypothetical protein
MTQVSTGVWTADNAWVSVDATVSFETADPALLHRTIGDARKAVEDAAVWALRDALGVLPLEQALNSADAVSRALPEPLNARMAGYGVRVTGFDVTSIAQTGPPSPGEDLWILRAADFSVVLRGYDRGRVDDLVKRAQQALLGDRPDLRASVARELGLPIPVRLRGYDRRQVDNLWHLLAAALEGRAV